MFRKLLHGMLVSAGCALLASSCAQSPLQACESVGACVDCQKTCERMLQCRVGFSESNVSPPFLDQSEQARCERGCATTDTITPERAHCILAANPAEPQRCHDEILVCLGVDAGPGY